MYNFEILDKCEIDFKLVDSFSNINVYKINEWLHFQKICFNSVPFLIKIFKNDEFIGLFVGEKIKKIITIVASPFEGRTTSFQGIILKDCISKEELAIIYSSLIDYLFKRNICSFFQVSDWNLDIDVCEKSGLTYIPISGYELDLTQDINSIYSNFKQKSCQYSIRKAQKNGVIIREPIDLDLFVEEYYVQLCEVFKKQNLTPTYSKQRVTNLVKALYASNSLLLLEAVSSENKVIATGIYTYYGKYAYFWGGASYSKYQSLCPNELLMFEAIKFCKNAGCEILEFGGGRTYKEKYGPVPYVKPMIVVAKYPVLSKLKDLMKWIYYKQRILFKN